MQQIAEWLKKLRMSEYTDRFVENRIDLRVLPDFMDQDKKSRCPVGARRKMLCVRSMNSATPRLPQTTLRAPGDRASEASPPTAKVFIVASDLWVTNGQSAKLSCQIAQ
jgi:hypothetical protein